MNLFGRKRREAGLEEPFLDGLLLETRLEPIVNEFRFTQKLLRRHRIEAAKSSVKYWSPALIGASVASLALLSLLQLLTSSSTMKPIHILNGDAAQNVDSITVDLPDGTTPRISVIR